MVRFLQSSRFLKVKIWFLKFLEILRIPFIKINWNLKQSVYSKCSFKQILNGLFDRLCKSNLCTASNEEDLWKLQEFSYLKKKILFETIQKSARMVFKLILKTCKFFTPAVTDYVNRFEFWIWLNPGVFKEFCLNHYFIWQRWSQFTV